MSLAQNFASQLKLRRAKKKWSQADVASQAGLSTSYVSMLENGRRVPTLETVAEIADVLGVDLTTMLKELK